MFDLRRNLRQTVSLERRTGENAWGESTYAAAVSVPARVEERRSRLLEAAGIRATVETRVLLAEPVEPGDRINGADVSGRETVVDFRGNVVGYTAFL